MLSSQPVYLCYLLTATCKCYSTTTIRSLYYSYLLACTHILDFEFSIICFSPSSWQINYIHSESDSLLLPKHSSLHLLYSLSFKCSELSLSTKKQIFINLEFNVKQRKQGFFSAMFWWIILISKAWFHACVVLLGINLGRTFSKKIILQTQYCQTSNTLCILIHIFKLIEKWCYNSETKK